MGTGASGPRRRGALRERPARPFRLGDASVSDPAILFGGPSPEHDVSVLTGLQAARALTDEGRAVTAIYWDKLGGFHEIELPTEAKDFADGAPKGARPIRLVAGADGGFIAEGRGGLRGGKSREVP